MLALVCLSALVCIANARVVQPTKESCNSPKYWCNNQETAKECGVLEYCKIEWGKTQATGLSVGIKGQTAKPDASPIKVSLYYESLWGGCRNFIHQQLFPTFTALDGTGILEIELVPYGNAREYQSGNQWVYYCQHGSAECYGNLIETCALHVLQKNSLQMPFISCLEQYGPTKANAMYCAQNAGITYEPIDSCVSGPTGNALQHQNALKTAALNPPHQYVPWITVDGVHTDYIQSEVQTNMLAYVCQNYKGTKPAACNGSTKKLTDVCYKD